MLHSIIYVPHWKVFYAPAQIWGFVMFASLRIVQYRINVALPTNRLNDLLAFDDKNFVFRYCISINNVNANIR
jgi:hypothetical protein